MSDGSNASVTSIEDARDSARFGPSQKATLAARIIQLLDDRGMSRRGLADEADLGISTVMKLLRGETDPPLGTLLAIAVALRLSTLDQLVTPSGVEVLTSPNPAATKVS